MVNKFRALEHQRTRILSDLLRMRAILRGSYARVLTKCGRDNCWCKEGEGHPHSRITWKEKGKDFTRKVPADQIAWVQKMTENYRTFRSLRRTLLQLEAESKKCLDEIENHLVRTTRSGKNFLDTNEGNRKGETPKAPKKKTRRKCGRA